MCWLSYGPSKLTRYIGTYSWPWIQLLDELLEDSADDGELTDEEDADKSSPNVESLCHLFHNYVPLQYVLAVTGM